MATNAEIAVIGAGAASQLVALGVGINVQPSAILVLRDLGLLPALQNTGIETQELNYYDRSGNPIISEPRGRFAGYKVPQFSIHRGQLQLLLLDTVQERLGDDRVYLDHTLKTFAHHDDQDKEVSLRFVKRKTKQPADIPKFEADLVVAADGINSTVRQVLYPDEGPPHFSGRLLWRGCLEREPYLTRASMAWSGHANQKFITYPISEQSSKEDPPQSLVNWIAELRVRGEDDPDTTPPRTDWTVSVPKDRFACEFKDWSFDFLNVPEIIEKTEKVFEYPMCDRDPVHRWSFGRLTLLGDAAHPTYPIGSNGASQAILDAASLTRFLLTCNGIEDIPRALKDYQDDMLPVTAKIVMANRGNGPDHVMQVAYERAPGGIKNIHDIIPRDELESIGSAYKKLAGFDIDKVNALADKNDGVAQKLGLISPKLWTSPE